MINTSEYTWSVYVSMRSSEPCPRSLELVRELGIDRYSVYTEKQFTEKELSMLFFLDFEVVGTRIYINL
jgi:hypothetical protein